MLKSSVLWIGDHQRAEFARIDSSVSVGSAITRAESCSEVVFGGSRPGIVMLAHGRPGELDLKQLNKLQTEWPQSQFVHVLGEWCCGWKRTSTEFGDVPQVYVHELPGDVTATSLVDLAVSRSSIWSSSQGKLAVIYSCSKSYRRGLADAVRLQNLKTVESSLRDPVSVQGADYVVWDAADNQEQRMADATVVRKRHPHANVVGLLTYPRDFEVESLREQGIAVLAQPFSLHSLSSFFRACEGLAVTSAA